MIGDKPLMLEPGEYFLSETIVCEDGENMVEAIRKQAGYAVSMQRRLDELRHEIAQLEQSRAWWKNMWEKELDRSQRYLALLKLKGGTDGQD